MYSLRQIVVVIFISLCQVRCSRDLSRSRAEKLIRESPHFSKDVTLPLQPRAGLLDSLQFSLEQVGLVHLALTNCFVSGAKCGTVKLTAKGLEAARGWQVDERGYHVPVASAIVVSVTGISEQPLVGTVAEFLWKCQLNDLGQKLKIDLRSGGNTDFSLICPPLNAVKQSRASFRHSDDGWRLTDILW